MKLFWGTFLLLLIACAVWLVVERPQPTTQSDVPESPELIASQTDQRPSLPEGSESAPSEPPAAPTQAESAPVTPAQSPLPEPSTTTPSHNPADPPPTLDLTTLTGDSPAAAPANPAPVDTEEVVAILPSTIVELPDGSLMVDGKYTIRGHGTIDDPYRISWELLASAQQLYNPRLGKRQLPQRVTMLNGKYVAITGYICMPVASPSTDELLVMLNQWDGCCIGVPPTPYDAVDVKLAERMNVRMNVAAYGSVTGRFVVEPYLAENWLLGLYRLESAKLSLQ